LSSWWRCCLGHSKHFYDDDDDDDFLRVADTSPQEHVYRGCHRESRRWREDACEVANVSDLPADLYGVGIIVGGTLCSCAAYCNTDVSLHGFAGNWLRAVITAASALIVPRLV